MISEESLTMVYQLLTLLAVIPGLWIAGRWLPDVEEWFRRIGAESIPSSRAVELIT